MGQQGPHTSTQRRSIDRADIGKKTNSDHEQKIRTSNLHLIGKGRRVDALPLGCTLCSGVSLSVRRQREKSGTTRNIIKEE